MERSRQHPVRAVERWSSHRQQSNQLANTIRTPGHVCGSHRVLFARRAKTSQSGRETPPRQCAQTAIQEGPEFAADRCSAILGRMTWDARCGQDLWSLFSSP